MRRVVVIGGGLAGLTAAFRLRERAAVILLEAAPRLGGQIETTLEHGFVVERGAEGFVARSEAVPALVRALGMEESELVGQALLRSYGFDGSALWLLEPGEAAALLGFQVPREDLGKGIRSLRHGMGSLIAALAAALRDRVTLCSSLAAVALEPSKNGQKSVRVYASDARVFEADAVIVATSARAAASLLAPLVAKPGRALESAPVLSSITVELAFERSSVAHALDASGLVVALPAQRDGMRACTFTSSKFAARAPEHKALLRAFLRPQPYGPALGDPELVALALSGLRRALGPVGEPLASWVSRWPDALPVFDDAHRAAVSALEQALAPHPIVLAGSAFHGAGIDAAVRSGERAASICEAPRDGSGFGTDA